jgi:AraC-like DNA-binding protein
MPRARSSRPATERADVVDLTDQLTELIEESKILRDVLIRNERAAARLRRQLQRSGSVLDAMDSLDDLMRGPRELPDALDHFEATRRRTRYILFALAAKQQLSLAELARRFGVSRQLVSRVVIEAGVQQRARAQAGAPGRPRRHRT